MATPDMSPLTHDHVFLGDDHERNELRVWLVTDDGLHDGHRDHRRRDLQLDGAGGGRLAYVHPCRRHACERTTITDLHVWQVGPGHQVAIISLVSPDPRSRRALQGAHISTSFQYVTVEVERHKV